MTRHFTPARRRGPRLGLALLLLLSCSREQARTEALTGPPDQQRARLSLSQIEPRPSMPEEVSAVDDAPIPDKAAEQLASAREAFAVKQWADAIEAAKLAIAEYPVYVDAHLLLAKAALRLDDLATAQVHADKAREIAPRNIEACMLCADIAAREGRLDDAIRDYRITLLVSQDQPDEPNHVLAHLRLSRVLAAERYLAAAAAELDAYLAAVDHPVETWSEHEELTHSIDDQRGRAAARLGDLRSQLDEHAAAATAYRKAVNESPDDRGLRAKLAISLAKSGRGDEAIDMARNLLANADANIADVALLQRVCTLANRSRQYPKVGIDVLSPIVAAEPASPAAVALASLYVEAQDAENCLGILLAALRTAPAMGEQFERLLERIDAAAAREYMAPAAADLAENNPTDACAAYIHARLLIAAGANEDAAAELKRTLTLEPPIVSARLATADLLIRKKDWTAARKCLADIEKSRDNAADIYRLQLMKGIVHNALSERAEAEAAFLRAAELAPHAPEPLYRLSVLLERAEDRQRCEELYRRIIASVDPRFVPAREKLVVLLLNSNRRDEADRFFDGFEELGIADPAAGRCRAMFNLADNDADDGEKRLEDYRADLWRLLEDYPDDAPTLVALAMSYLAAGDYDGAIVQADRAVELDPSDIRAREIKATLDAKLLQFDEAGATIRSLLEDRPRDIAYHQKLMELSMNVGDYETAIDVVRAMIEREDLRAGRGLFIAQLLELLLLDDQNDEAVRTAKAWLDEEPTDGPRREAYITTLGSAERYDEAIESVRGWLDDDPGNARLRRSYVNLLQSAGRIVEAQQQVLEWLERTPDDIDLNRILIALFWAGEEWDAAVELARTCAELPESAPFYESLLGQTYVFARRYDRAIELYRKRTGETQTIASYRDLIALLIQAERLIEAEQIANKILMPELIREAQKRRYDPELVIAMRQYLSRIYQLLNRNDDAIQQLEAIHRMTPGDAGINNDLGYTYLEAGMNLDEAEHMIRLAVGEQPREPAYLDSLGWLLYKRGKFDEAVIYLQRALDFSSRGDAVMHDHLADALYKTGRIEEAAVAWREAAGLCTPSKSRSLSPEETQLVGALHRKLAQLEAAEPVDVAPLAGQQPTTQAASQPDSAAPPDASTASAPVSEPESDAPPPDTPRG